MINVFGSCVGKEEFKEIKDCIKNQWLGIGKKVETFEKMMTDKIGVSDFTAVDSGSNALYMAVNLLDLKAGSEVIIPSITWISCANAVILCGLKPVFCDVDYDSVNATPKTISEAITKNTSAIMIVHYAGLPVLAGFDIPIIADCAHAVDTYIEWNKDNWKHIANYSDVSIFSFDSIKNVACGELGGIYSSNLLYADKPKNMRYCGLIKSGLQASTEKKRWWEYELIKPFPKMLPNDLTASIGIAQLKKLPFLQSRRKQIWGIYQRELKDINWIITPPAIPKFIKHSYFTYFIKVLNGKRDKLARYLLDNGIYTTVRYEPLHLYKQFGSKQTLPVAEKLNEELLNLPLHPNLSDKDLDYIITKIKEFI